MLQKDSKLRIRERVQIQIVNLADFVGKMKKLKGTISQDSHSMAL